MEAEHTPLPSWRHGATRRAILDFVASISTGADAIPEAERIAVFDNDGTLWSEKPMPTQLHYVVEKWVELATADPALAQRQPYKAAVSGDFAWLGHAIDKHYAGDDSDLKTIIAALLETTDEMSVSDYRESVSAFYREARHPARGTAYSETVYRPMIELLRYLEANGFTCYIVSGGERDFMRPMTTEYYGLPPERVIGTSIGMHYDEASNDVRYRAALGFFDDGPEKPVRIWTRIGRRPVLAVGNSNGDIPMLRFVQKHPLSLSLVVHHDDDSGRGDEPYDKGAEKILAEADSSHFTVISVRDDWDRVFV